MIASRRAELVSVGALATHSRRGEDCALGGSDLRSGLNSVLIDVLDIYGSYSLDGLVYTENKKNDKKWPKRRD